MSHPSVSLWATSLEELVDIDWSHLIWQARWSGLETLWAAVLVNASTYWWFGPLVVVMLVKSGRRGIIRLLSYVGRVFVRAHSGS